MRIVIECKRGVDPAAVLTKLYRLTDLRTTINVNMVALVDGAPRTLGLREALVAYVAHQREVLTRRTAHRLARARARAHVVEGLLSAIDQLDAVIATIRAADSAADAKQDLMDGFELSEIQAQAVLDMQLRRLAALERAQLEDEYQELMARIAELEGILGDASVLDGVLVEELKALRARFANERRTRIDVARDDEDGEETAPDVRGPGGHRRGHPWWGREVGRAPPSDPRPRDTRPDPVVAVLPRPPRTCSLLVDAGGTAHRVAVGDVPVVRPTARGTHVGGLLGGGPDAPLDRCDRRPRGRRRRSRWSPSARRDSSSARCSPRCPAHVNARSSQPASRTGTSSSVRHCLRGRRAAARPRRWVSPSASPPRACAHGTQCRRRHGHAHRRRPHRRARGRPGRVRAAPLVSVGAAGVVRRFALDELSLTGRGGKGVKVGDVPLAWFGPRADLHLTVGGEPTRPAHRGARDRPTLPARAALGGTVLGVVTAEVGTGGGERCRVMRRPTGWLAARIHASRPSPA
jgi:DNA gyrase subunit A